MISISKEEKQAVREKFQRVHIVRTMKQCSKRHRYYMEEAPGAMKLIRQMRGIEEPSRKRGA